VDELQRLGLQSDAGAGDAADAVSREMLESNVDSTDWKLEVERILPQLRATVNTDSKVYRTTIKKGRYSYSWEPHLRATGRHLPYRITQCYLPPYTSERAPPNPSLHGWYSIYLPRRDGRLS